MEWYFSSMQAADRLDTLSQVVRQYSVEANELPGSTRRFWTGEAAMATAELLQRYADGVSLLPEQISQLASAIRAKALQLEAENRKRDLEAQAEIIEGGTDNE